MSQTPNDQTNQGRRTFLKSSSAALAGGTLAASLGSRAHAQGSNELKIALVGCGGRGTGAANQALNTSGPTKLWAMADAFEDRLEDSRQRLKRIHKDKIDVAPERRFSGLDAYKKAIDSGADVVILATPPGWRPPQFEYAVEQGKNIFMEKPVATDAPGVRRVLAAAEKAKKKNLKVGVGLQRHHHRVYQETIDRIQNGEIGDVVNLRVYWNGGGVWTRGRRSGMSEMEYQTLNWYYFTWLCGDHIIEQHIHNLDVGNWVKGETQPIAAQGQGGREVRTGDEHGQIFDHHAVEFTYADGTKMFSQCRHIRGCWNEVAEYAHGTKGSANIGGGMLFSDQRQKERAWRYRGDSPNPYQVEHDVLFDAIRNNKQHMEAERGAKSTMTALLGRMCTYSGKLIRWSQAINSDLNLSPGQDDYTMETTPPIVPGKPVTRGEGDDAETVFAMRDAKYPVPVPGETVAY